MWNPNGWIAANFRPKACVCVNIKAIGVLWCPYMLFVGMLSHAVMMGWPSFNWNPWSRAPTSLEPIWWHILAVHAHVSTVHTHDSTVHTHVGNVHMHIVTVHARVSIGTVYCLSECLYCNIRLIYNAWVILWMLICFRWLCLTSSPTPRWRPCCRILFTSSAGFVFSLWIIYFTGSHT
jgi:hypothetical protein